MLARLLLLLLWLPALALAADPDDVRVPPDAAQNVRTLSAYLVGTAHTPTSKARRIYRWITQNINYDVPAVRGSKPASVYEPQQVLQRRQTVCEGYARLFQALAQEAGLEAKVVSGKTHRSISDSAGGHAWNAVRLDGNWTLLDCTWGAGYVKGDDYFRAPTDYYFGLDPKVMVASHFPSDETWQLLETPISQAEFEASTPPRAPRAGRGERITLLQPGETPRTASTTGPTATPGRQRLASPRLLYSYHTRGATLMNPKQGTLSGSNQDIHLLVPGADKILVDTGDQTFELIPVPRKPGAFRALVPVSPGRVRVVGVFAGRSEPLVEFEAE